MIKIYEIYFRKIYDYILILIMELVKKFEQYFNDACTHVIYDENEYPAHDEMYEMMKYIEEEANKLIVERKKTQAI